MSTDEHMIVTETVEQLLAEVFSDAEPMHSIVVDDFTPHEVESVDLVVESVSAQTPAEDDPSATSETPVVEEPFDHPLIDQALRRASGIFADSQERADEVIAKAHTNALRIVEGAEDTATELIAEARAEAARIEEQAEQAVLDAIEVAREEYRVKATKIANQAIEDSQLLVSDAEERAMDVYESAQTKAERMIENAVATIAEREALAKETLAALTDLVDSRVGDAALKAAAVQKQAHADATDLQERTETEARELLVSSRSTAERLVAQGQADADLLVTNAQAQAEAIMTEVEDLKTTAHARLWEASKKAAQRGRAAARDHIDSQLIDTRREIEELEALAVAKRQEIAAYEAQLESEPSAA